MILEDSVCCAVPNPWRVVGRVIDNTVHNEVPFNVTKIVHINITRAMGSYTSEPSYFVGERTHKIIEEYESI